MVEVTNQPQGSHQLPIRRADRKNPGAPLQFITQAKVDAHLALNAAVVALHAAKVDQEHAMEVMCEATAAVEQAHERMIRAQLLLEATN